MEVDIGKCTASFLGILAPFLINIYSFIVPWRENIFDQHVSVTGYLKKYPILQMQYAGSVARAIKNIDAPSCVEGSSATVTSLKLCGENVDWNDDIASMCKKSSFGFGTETIQDPSVRLGYESEDFEIDLDPNSHPEILKGVSRLLRSDNFTIKQHKLNVYTTGGFFDEHRDTSKSMMHVATLLIRLPSEFKGGELVVNNDNVLSNKNNWVAFFTDCEHQVSKVTSGVRLTVSYKIYDRSRLGNYVDTELETKLKQCTGRKIGYVFEYLYLTHGKEPNIEEIVFKGRDKAVMSVLHKLGLDYELKIFQDNEDVDKDDVEVNETFEEKIISGYSEDEKLYLVDNDDEQLCPCSKWNTSIEGWCYTEKLVDDLDRIRDQVDLLVEPKVMRTLGHRVFLGNEGNHGDTHYFSQGLAVVFQS